MSGPVQHCHPLPSSGLAIGRVRFAIRRGGAYHTSRSRQPHPPTHTHARTEQTRRSCMLSCWPSGSNVKPSKCRTRKVKFQDNQTEFWRLNFLG